MEKQYRDLRRLTFDVGQEFMLPGYNEEAFSIFLLLYERNSKALNQNLKRKEKMSLMYSEGNLLVFSKYK